MLIPTRLEASMLVEMTWSDTLLAHSRIQISLQPLLYLISKWDNPASAKSIFDLIENKVSDFCRTHRFAPILNDEKGFHTVFTRSKAKACIFAVLCEFIVGVGLEMIQDEVATELQAPVMPAHCGYSFTNKLPAAAHVLTPQPHAF